MWSEARAASNFCGKGFASSTSLVFDTAMAQPTQSIAATFPPEIISHILALAVDAPASISEVLQQRNTLFAASELCRSWSAQASRMARSTVTSQWEAEKLAVKLSQLDRRTIPTTS